MNRRFELVKTAYLTTQLELSEGAQIALAGRSNVGKSSLINCLANRKGLAKTSSTPGKTQSVNFYHIMPQNYTLVDLPGYGYARRSQEERAKWGQLIERFLKDNPGLRGVAVLIDVRVPAQKSDLEVVSWLRNENIPILPVLTKCDKVKQLDRSAKQREWSDLLGGVSHPLCFSSVTGMGRDKLWAALDEMGSAGDEADAEMQGE